MDIRKNVHKILENFEVTDLPSLPQVLVELVESCYRVDVTFEQYAAWIEMDPGLTAQTLSLLGASSRGTPARVTSLASQLKTLGRDTLKALAVSAAAREARASTGATAVSVGFWRRSVRCAIISRMLAAATGYHSPDEAYLAGLLHNLGQLVYETIQPQAYRALRGKAQRDTQLLLLEREQFGAGHTDLGASLIETWGLNSFMADAARYHHQPLGYVLDAHPLVQVVFLANLLSRGESRPLEKGFEAAEQLFGLGQGALVDLISKAGDAVAEVNRKVDLPPARGGEHERRPNAGSASDASARLAGKVAEIALLDGVRPRLKRASDRTALLRALARSACLILGNRPALFFLPEPATGVLTGLNPDRDDDLAGELKILPERGGSLICRALDQRRLLHSFDEGAQPLAVIDRQIISLLDSSGMLCLPLVGCDARLGVLVMGVDRAQLPRLQRQRTLLEAFAAEGAAQLKSIEQPPAAAASVKLEPDSADERTRQIVHEVNNPLSIARNYLQVLSMKLGAGHPASKDIEVIEEELVRVSELVLQLTELPDVGSDPERETVAVNSLITNLLRVSRDALLLPKQIEVELELDEELPPILSSTGSLKQILINLVQNASEAMSQGGRLKIRTRDWHRFDATPFVEIDVSDDGPGIPREVEARIFQPLTSTKGEDHAGLGLSIVKKLVEELGGSIGYQSSAEAGTSFRVLLPRVLGERRAPVI